MWPDNPVDDESAIAVELAAMCKQLRVLPRAGGLLDQDSYQLRLIRAGLSAMAELEQEEIKKASRKK